MDLLDDIRLFDQDRVDELHQFVLKGEPFLAQLAVEHSGVVDIQFLAALVVKSFFFFHGSVCLRTRGSTCLQSGCLGLLPLALA